MKNKTVYLKLMIIAAIFVILIGSQVFAATNSKITNLTANVENERVYLNWGSITEASGYEVLLNIPGYGYYNLGNVTTNKAELQGLAKGFTYTAKIRPYKKVNGNKSYLDDSNEVSVKIGNDYGIKLIGTNIEVDNTDNKVKNLKVNINGKKAELKWDKVENVSGYEIHLNIPGLGYYNIGSVTTNNATITGFANNSTYFAKVRAYTEINGEKKYYNFSDEIEIKIGNGSNKPTQTPTKNPTPTPTNTPTPTQTSTPTPTPTQTRVKPAKVTGVKVDVSGDRATFSWNWTTHAEGYELNLFIPGIGYIDYTELSRRKTLSGFTDTNNPYYVKVRAYNTVNGKKQYGEYSDTVSFRITEIKTKPAKVTGLITKTAGDRAAFAWNKVEGAEGYELNLMIPGLGYFDYYTTDPYKVLSGFEVKRSRYAVKVRAYNTVNGKKQYGEYSETVTFAITEDTYLAKVTGLKGTVYGTAVRLNWNKVNGAEGYEITLKMPGIGDITLTEASTSRYISGFSKYPDAKYTAKVRAYKTINGKRVYGEYSNDFDYYIK